MKLTTESRSMGFAAFRTFAVAILIAAPGVHAASFVVTSNGDDSNASNSAVTCIAGSPTCTLREALLEADADGWGNSNLEVITFALPSSEIALQNYFLPVVFVNLAIDGRESNGTDVTISGGNQWRIFLLGDDGTALPPSGGLPRRISVSLQHLILTDGVARGGDGGGAGAGLGGAVFVNSQADVSISDVTFKLN